LFFPVEVGKRSRKGFGGQQPLRLTFCPGNVRLTGLNHENAANCPVIIAELGSDEIDFMEKYIE
jgi:hypothetical protein